STGGSDSHSGRRYDPESTESRGAGSASLTVVYGAEATRAGIWNGMTRRHTYALSRLREIGPVHKGRVAFYTADPAVLPPRGRVAAFAGGDIGDVPTGTEHVMGDLVEAAAVGTPRNFTIAAGAEVGTTGIYPKELRLYRVRPDTPLSTATSFESPWLDDQ